MNAELLRGLFAKNSSEYAKNHRPSIQFKDFPNMRTAAVISCMDPRSNPNEYINVGEYGPAIVRTAGGRAQDALRSLRVLAGVSGYGKNTLGVVAVVHHVDCGLINFDNHFIACRLKELGKDSHRHSVELDRMDLVGFTDLEASIKDDIALIKADPFLPRDLEVIGFTHDPFTGETNEVV